MLTIPCPAQLLVCLHLSVLWYICLLCFHYRRMTLLFHQFKSIFVAAVRSVRKIWSAPLRSADYNHHLADHHRIPSLIYQPGQKVWLSSKYIPLKTDSKKQYPRYLDPFEIDRVINPSAVRLKLPRAIRIHPSFHVSQIKPVQVLSIFNPFK